MANIKDLYAELDNLESWVDQAVTAFSNTGDLMILSEEMAAIATAAMAVRKAAGTIIVALKFGQ